MFVGHALLAFSLTVYLARRFSVPRERALRYGVVAGLFAAVPDVDIVYAPVGLLLRSLDTVSPDVFWATANVIHRGPTHSLLMAAALAVAVALWAVGTRPASAASIAVAALLVAVGGFFSGTVGAVVVIVFVLAGFAVGRYGTQRGLAPLTLLAVGLVGLLSHPFGDLFTGSPPPFLYPFDIVVVAERVALHPDPTANLLLAFAIELGIVWLAILTYARTTDIALMEYVSARATLGVGYAAAALLLPTPTLEQSAVFVFSVLAIGAVGAPVRPFRNGVEPREVVVTGLSAVTVAALAYALAYGIL